LKTLKSLDPMSLATMAGIAGAVWGLFVAVAVIFLRSAFTTLMGRFYTVYTNMLPAYTFGPAAIIVLPIAYGLTGFVGAYIAGLVYNILAKRFGGIKVDLN
jgi:hypothetical protein